MEIITHDVVKASKGTRKKLAVGAARALTGLSLLMSNGDPAPAIDRQRVVDTRMVTHTDPDTNTRYSIHEDYPTRFTDTDYESIFDRFARFETNRAPEDKVLLKDILTQAKKMVLSPDANTVGGWKGTSRESKFLMLAAKDKNLAITTYTEKDQNGALAVSRCDMYLLDTGKRRIIHIGYLGYFDGSAPTVDFAVKNNVDDSIIHEWGKSGLSPYNGHKNVDSAEIEAVRGVLSVGIPDKAKTKDMRGLMEEVVDTFQSFLMPPKEIVPA